MCRGVIHGRRMIDAIDQIDWASLEHAYGPATDVPKLLRAVASGDAHDSDSALYDLNGNICHQGSIYSATAKAIPFLVEIVEARATPHLDQLIWRLGAISDGTTAANETAGKDA